MIDVEPLIRSELDRLVPLPADGRADWRDVRRRARPPLRRRPLVLALAAAFAVLVSAAALAASLGGFDAWLSGKPGKPAPESAQRAFRAANGRSWAAFPRTTELRELIKTDRGGRRYVLYGFRSGSSLCLRLEAVSLGKHTQSCAPVSALARTNAPFVVVLGDWVLTDQRAHPLFAAAQISFGIVADGVSRVDVHAIDGEHRALVGGNAYLWVLDEPNTTNRVLAISAIDARGRRTTARFPDRLPWILSASGRPGGPSRVEARIENPKVGWHVRGEKRGFRALGGLRFVKPDPLSDIAVGLSGNLCLVALRPSGELSAQSCGTGFFFRGPVNALIGCDVCGEFMELRGVAADGVTRVAVFLADGTRQTVPLRHNLFATRIGRTQFPIRIVGYDARGRVVATQLWGFGPHMAVPAAAKRVRPVLHRTGPNGTFAQLHVGPRVRGFHCWRVDFSTGQSRGGCVPPIVGGGKIHVDLIQPAGGDIFVVGTVKAVVERVDLELPLRNRIASIRPRSGHFLFAIPRRYVGRERHHAYVVGFDSFGFRAQRQGFEYRLRRPGD